MTEELNEIIAAVTGKAVEGRLACAVAFSLAQDLAVAPAEIGKAADVAKIKLNRCQLGLFGYYPEKRIVAPAQTIAPPLETSIRGALTDGRLTCAAAWDIARNLGVAKMDVASACEALGIRIKFCQLGAF